MCTAWANSSPKSTAWAIMTTVSSGSEISRIMTNSKKFAQIFTISALKKVLVKMVFKFKIMKVKKCFIFAKMR
jgi:hypothetical protein